MKKGLFMLAAFLGALGIGLFWLSGFIENIKETSHAAGKAECEAEQAKKVVAILDKEKEVLNVQTRQAAVVWARPNSRLSGLIKRMREQGIGSACYHTENSGLSAGR